MFVIGKVIEGAWDEKDTWNGHYRGGTVVVKEHRTKNKRPMWKAVWRTRLKGVIGYHEMILAKKPSAALRSLKYKVDWFLWVSDLPPSQQEAAERVGELVSDNAQFMARRLAKKETYTTADLVKQTLRLSNEEANETWHESLGHWWYQYTERERTEFVEDSVYWLAARKKLPGLSPVATWGIPPPPAEPVPKQESEPAERPEPPEVVPQAPQPSHKHSARPFGYCKRCRVCLAYDVNEGCCTVCGAPLYPNPRLKRTKRQKRTSRGMSPTARRLLRRL